MALDPRLNKPIPGYSLTNKPKGFAFERPPEVTDPNEAIMLHLKRLTTGKRMEDLYNVLDTGQVSVVDMTKGILRSAVAEGIHTIDVSMLIAPVLHEFIKVAASEAGVDYEEGFGNPEKEEEKRKRFVFAKALRKADKMKNDPEFMKGGSRRGVSDPDEMPPEDSVTEAPKPLMQRPIPEEGT